MKRIFKMKYKTFLIIFKKVFIKANQINFECEGPTLVFVLINIRYIT